MREERREKREERREKREERRETREERTLARVSSQNCPNFSPETARQRIPGKKPNVLILGQVLGETFAKVHRRRFRPKLVPKSPCGLQVKKHQRNPN